jgi:hypothetical protein
MSLLKPLKPICIVFCMWFKAKCPIEVSCR